VPIFAQVMRTGSLVFSGCGRQVQLDVLALFQLEVLVGAELGLSSSVDALGADGGNQVVRSSGCEPISSQHVVDIAVGEIALFLADFNGLSISCSNLSSVAK